MFKKTDFEENLRTISFKKSESCWLFSQKSLRRRCFTGELFREIIKVEQGLIIKALRLHIEKTIRAKDLKVKTDHERYKIKHYIKTL